MNHARRADVFQTRAEESFTHANTSEPLTSDLILSKSGSRMRTHLFAALWCP